MARKKLRTPLILPRKQGGTFYTFSSALEDVGLNINELHNKVEMSHYVLLDLPPFEDIRDNSIIEKEQIASKTENINPGDNAFATLLQDYALNFETILRNDTKYDFSESLTVSERVFWKFLRKYFGFKVEETHDGYFQEPEDSSSYTRIVKGFGSISAGAQRTDSYGIYNETFVQIPSSYGQMPVIFKPVSDNNYYKTDENHKYKHVSDSSLYDNVIEYVNPNDIASEFIPVTPVYDDDKNTSYIVDELDELSVELSKFNLRKYYNSSSLEYDDLATDSDYVINEKYNFNAVLVYYSIYDSTGKILATNAYGILLLDNSAPYSYKNQMISNGLNVKTYKFNSIEKYRTTASMSGNSYSFRLNIKASNVYSREITIEDNSTPAYEMSTEFSDMIKNLSNAIDVLRSNANTIKILASEHEEIKNFAANALDKVDDLEKDVNNLKNGTSRNLVVETLSAKHISTDTIDSSFDFYNHDGSICGSVDDGKLRMDSSISAKELDASILDSDIVKTSSIENSSDISFRDSTNPNKENILAKINSNGVYTQNSLFIPNKDNDTSTYINISNDDADELLKSIKIFQDNDSNTLYLNTKHVSTTINNRDLLAPESNYVNIINVLLLMIKRLQTKLGSAAELDAKFNEYTESINLKVDKIDKSLNEHNDNLNNLKDNIGEISKTVKDLDSSIGNVKDAVDKLNDYDFANIKESLDDLKEKQKEQNTKNNELESNLNETNKKFSDLDTSVGNRLDTIGEEIKEGVKDYYNDKFDSIDNKLEELNNEITNRFNDTSTKINDIDSSLKKLNDSDTSVVNRLAQIDSNIKEGVKDYNSKFDDINKQFEDLKNDSSTRFSDISNELENLDSSFNTLDASTSLLQTNYAGMKNSITSLMQEQQELSKTVEGMKDDINKIKKDSSSDVSSGGDISSN